MKKDGLNEGAVRGIKEALMAGFTIAEVARAYGKSGETIGRIKRGLTWKNVVVEGEEVLRPVNRLVASETGRAEPRVPYGMLPSAEVIQRSLEKVMRLQAGEDVEKVERDERLQKEFGLAAPGVIAQLKLFGKIPQDWEPRPPAVVMPVAGEVRAANEEPEGLRGKPGDDPFADMVG